MASRRRREPCWLRQCENHLAPILDRGPPRLAGKRIHLFDLHQSSAGWLDLATPAEQICSLVLSPDIAWQSPGLSLFLFCGICEIRHLKFGLQPRMRHKQTALSEA